MQNDVEKKKNFSIGLLSLSGLDSPFLTTHN